MRFIVFFLLSATAFGQEFAVAQSPPQQPELLRFGSGEKIQAIKPQQFQIELPNIYDPLQSERPKRQYVRHPPFVPQQPQYQQYQPAQQQQQQFQQVYVARPAVAGPYPFQPAPVFRQYVVQRPSGPQVSPQVPQYPRFDLRPQPARPVRPVYIVSATPPPAPASRVINLGRPQAAYGDDDSDTTHLNARLPAHPVPQIRTGYSERPPLIPVTQAPYLERPAPRPAPYVPKPQPVQPSPYEEISPVPLQPRPAPYIEKPQPVRPAPYIEEPEPPVVPVPLQPRPAPYIEKPEPVIPVPVRPAPVRPAPYIAPTTVRPRPQPIRTRPYIAPTTRRPAPPVTTTQAYIAPVTTTTPRPIRRTTTTAAPTTTRRRTTTTPAPTTTRPRPPPPPPTTTTRRTTQRPTTTTSRPTPRATRRRTTTTTPIPTTTTTEEPITQGYEEAVETPVYDETFVGQYYYGRKGEGGNNTFPLPSCFYNPSGYVCCSLMLNELMTTSFEEVRVKTNKCNVHRFAVKLQKHSEKIFETQFETIVSYEDFSQKIHFKKDLVCKVEIDGRFILAYATPEDVEQEKIIPTVPSRDIQKDSITLKEEVRHKIRLIEDGKEL